jgi:hypothetical protein
LRLYGWGGELFDFPIGGGIFDAPEIAGNIEFEAHEPGLGIATQGHNFGHSRRGVALRRNDLQANWNALPEFTGRNQAASVGVHEGGIALFGKWLRGIEAGHSDRNFQGQASAAPDRVLCFFRMAHRFSGNREKIGANRSSDKCAFIMLDHKKAVSTEFRRPGFQLDTSAACVATGGK